MNGKLQVICLECNLQASVIDEPRYNGLRGICPHCGGNWPES